MAMPDPERRQEPTTGTAGEPEQAAEPAGRGRRRDRSRDAAARPSSRTAGGGRSPTWTTCASAHARELDRERADGTGPGGGGVAAGARQPRAGARARRRPSPTPSSRASGPCATRRVDVLARLGFPRHDETGVPFDPARHEAVGVVDRRRTPRRARSSQVLRPGYGDGRAAAAAGGRGRRRRGRSDADGPRLLRGPRGVAGRERRTRSSRPTASWPASYHPDVNKDPGPRSGSRRSTRPTTSLRPRDPHALRPLRPRLPAGARGLARSRARRGAGGGPAAAAARRRRPAAPGARTASSGVRRRRRHRLRGPVRRHVRRRRRRAGRCPGADQEAELS